MKVYHGSMTDGGAEVFVTDGAGRRELNPRFDLRKHSLTGFAWGYGGSGPAQLALALTADALGDDDRARDVYQQFKFKVVASLTGDTWTLTEDQVKAAVADISGPKPASRGRETAAGRPADSVGRATSGLLRDTFDLHAAKPGRVSAPTTFRVGVDTGHAGGLTPGRQCATARGFPTSKEALMPTRKRKTTDAAPDTAVSDAYEPPAATEAPAAPDVFDEAIAARDAAETTPVPPAGAEPPAAAPADPDKKTAFQPDPHKIVTVPLGEGKDGPSVRLFRSQRFRQMAIQFDVAPPEKYRRLLGDEGYRWREKELVWTIQFGDSPTATQAASERLVNRIANDIRAEVGLPPVGRAVGG